MHLAVELGISTSTNAFEAGDEGKQIDPNVHVQLHLVGLSVEISLTERMKSGCRWRAGRDVKMEVSKERGANCHSKMEILSCGR